MNADASHEPPAPYAGARFLTTRHRLRWWEALPWLLAIAYYFAFPDYLGFGAELLSAILFALSLDLALGYAGIISLGHAAFFGVGAYTAGMLALYGIGPSRSRACCSRHASPAASACCRARRCCAPAASPS